VGQLATGQAGQQGVSWAMIARAMADQLGCVLDTLGRGTGHRNLTKWLADSRGHGNSET